MALCLEVGNNAVARGICCVAVGDNVVVRGAYQVEVGEEITLSDKMTIDQMSILIPQLEDLILTYNALSDQKVAPADFGKRASNAVGVAINALRQKCREKK
jgi:hypothetical protein